MPSSAYWLPLLTPLASNCRKSSTAIDPFCEGRGRPLLGANLHELLQLGLAVDDLQDRHPLQRHAVLLEAHLAAVDAGEGRILPERLRQARSEEHTSELQSLMRIS